MSLLFAFLTSFALFCISYWATPDWVETLNEKKGANWKRFNLIALVSSLLVSVMVILFMSPLEDVSLQALVGATVAAITYAAVQSITDLFVRRAYRWTLRAANIIVFALATWYILTSIDSHFYAYYLLCLFFASLSRFIPSIGQSDTRALLLVFISAIPLVGMQGLYYIYAAFFVIIILYGLIEGAKIKNFNIFKTKISAPMVPLILFPTMATIVSMILL